MKITLCGSARFENYFKCLDEVLTLSGHTVYTLSVYPSDKPQGKNWYTEEEKRLLDEAHLRKIEASDAILVINPFAYIGESTLNEIEYARTKGKRLFALESWGEGNGLGNNHFSEVRDLSESYGLTRFTRSPIPTHTPHFKDIWDLLPEAGSFRSSLVERIRGVEKNHINKGDI